MYVNANVCKYLCMYNLTCIHIYISKHMYVYIYMYMYKYIYIYYVYKNYTCIYIYIDFLCVYEHTCVYIICIYICVCECAFAFANTCVSIYIYMLCKYIYTYMYIYIYIYTYIHTYLHIFLSIYIYIQRGSGTEPRTAKGTGNIGTEPEPFIYFIVTNRTQPVGNRTVWSANRKHEPVANRLRTAGICLFSIYSSTGFFARVRPAIFLATCACAKISLAAEEKKGENGERRETGKSNGLESRYFRLRLQN